MRKRANCLNDPRGELRALADELLRSGICSLLFTPQINVGELDLFAHEMSRSTQRDARRYVFAIGMG